MSPWRVISAAGHRKGSLADGRRQRSLVGLSPHVAVRSANAQILAERKATRLPTVWRQDARRRQPKDRARCARGTGARSIRTGSNRGLPARKDHAGGVTGRPPAKELTSCGAESWHACDASCGQSSVGPYRFVWFPKRTPKLRQPIAMETRIVPCDCCRDNGHALADQSPSVCRSASSMSTSRAFGS
jgi:hypothetical protein